MYLTGTSEPTLIRGKHFVPIHKRALIITRFYAQFKFKSFLLDTANTSVMWLLIFLLNN